MEISFSACSFHIYNKKENLTCDPRLSLVYLLFNKYTFYVVYRYANQSYNYEVDIFLTFKSL